MVRRGPLGLAHHNVAGFSLIELLLTVVFVALGSQMVQGGFLRAADLFGRYSNTLKVIVWSSEQEANAREALLMGETQSSRGLLDTSNKELRYEQSVDMADLIDLYSIKQTVLWSEGARNASFEKEFYVYQTDTSQTI